MSMAMVRLLRRGLPTVARMREQFQGRARSTYSSTGGAFSVFDWRAALVLTSGSIALAEEAKPSTEDQKHELPPSVDGSPFGYMKQVVEERAEREKRLLDLRAKARHRIFLLQQRLQRREISEDAFRLEMHKLKTDVNREAQKYIFGVPAEMADARDIYLQDFGCVKWSDDAMREIASLSPLIEIGAGNGQWKRELETKWKADILAFDNMSLLPLTPEKDHRDIVLEGDETALTQHKGRTLLLVCPPPTRMPLNCLRKYSGDTFVYVGEGRGGAHGDDAFFDELEKNWEVAKVIQVEPFPDCFEKCFILKRKQRGWFSWLW